MSIIIIKNFKYFIVLTINLLYFIRNLYKYNYSPFISITATITATTAVTTTVTATATITYIHHLMII